MHPDRGEDVAGKFVSNDNYEKLWRSESCNNTFVDSNVELLKPYSDGDNVVWVGCGAVKGECSEMDEVTEFDSVKPWAVEQCNIGSDRSVYSGDYKPELCDWKLPMEPFVSLDILNIAHMVKPHPCQKAVSPYSVF
jgi:hypothetical protein